MQEQSLQSDGRLGMRIIAFGFIATFVSSFGQTFFLGLFSPQFEAATGIGGAGLGMLYGLATLLSGSLLFWLGGALDRVPLRRAILIASGIYLAGSLLAGSVGTQTGLLAAFFLLRLGGQGLMSHLGIVTAARGGGRRKGAMIAWASMGVILGEAVLPAAVLAAVAVVEWRWLWHGVSALLLCAVLPALLLFGRGLPWMVSAGDAGTPQPSIGQRRVLLRQPAFWAGAALLLAPPFMATGFLFEQAAIGRLMHWSPQSIGAAFMVFALSRALGTWGYGRLADRFGALRMARLHLLPMALAFASLAVPLGSASIWVAFAGVGFTNGANSVLGGAVWVDLFGTASIGLVRGVFVACTVLATAVAPAVTALMLSPQIGAGAMGLAFAAYCVLASLLAGPALLRRGAAEPD
jgi:MFS family permease